MSDAAARAQNAVFKGLLALPPRARRRLAGRPPAVAAGLDPEAWFVARLASSRREALPVSGAAEREVFRAQIAPVTGRADVPVRVEHRSIPGPHGGVIPARLYVPERAPAAGPLHVHYHGGGWVLGDLDTHDVCLRLLAHHSGVRVLSVDYRLAPEDPFPAAAHDAIAAYRHVAAQPESYGADPARLAVGGDSAGGNLAAVVAQQTRADERPPAFQLLLYPVCDLTHGPDRYRSYVDYAEGFLLSAERMAWFDEQYVPDPQQRADPLASPLLADDVAGVAPAYVAVSIADPLRDEGEAYAARLREAGVPVSLHHQPLLHGFFNLGGLRTGQEAIALTAGVLREALGRPAA